MGAALGQRKARKGWCMKKTIAAVCLGVSFPVVAAAEDFSAGAAAGILNGNAKELVYNTADRSKLSELTW